MRQFLNWEKKRLEGWSAQMTHLPMASASAVVVATTSEVEGLMNTWGPGGTGGEATCCQASFRALCNWATGCW